MSVLDRAALEASPLADLHALASELSIDGYRRLRRPELISSILARQTGEEAAPPADESEEKPAGEAQQAGEAGEDREPTAEAGEERTPTTEDREPADDDEERGPSRRRRGRRGGRGRGAKTERAAEEGQEEEPEAKGPKGEAPEAKGPKGEGPEAAAAPEGAPAPAATPEEEIVTGVVELLPNGSGFVRVEPPEPSDDDVYISAAQVKRCELVSGDRIAGPRRPPRRSERFASLVRIDTINDRPAEEVADSARFDDLPSAFPSEPFRFGSEDPTLKAIESVTPFGRGSRVTIAGPAGAGKSEALRRLAGALAGVEGIQLSVALAGVRPEEISEWSGGPAAPTAAVSFASSPDAQGNAVELVVDQARRVAARGADAVVLIDTLDGLHPGLARKAIAAARNVVDGGSLTVIATASQPVGGETTVIALDRTLASTGRFPAIDPVASATLRAELLVGEADAEAIVKARGEALGLAS